jgi:beta-galactosidase
VDCTDKSNIRKVDKMNEDYLLKEVGAVLNWFDVTEREGYFSLNDKISDIMATTKGKLWFAKFGLKMKKAMSGGKDGEKPKPAGFDVDMKDVMGMLGGFSVLRLSSMSQMMGLTFTKEELLEYNRQLNKIKKPKVKTPEQKQKDTKTKKAIAIGAVATTAAAAVAITIGKLASKRKK